MEPPSKGSPYQDPVAETLELAANDSTVGVFDSSVVLGPVHEVGVSSKETMIKEESNEALVIADDRALKNRVFAEEPLIERNEMKERDLRTFREASIVEIEKNVTVVEEITFTEVEENVPASEEAEKNVTVSEELLGDTITASEETSVIKVESNSIIYEKNSAVDLNENVSVDGNVSVLGEDKNAEYDKLESRTEADNSKFALVEECLNVQEGKVCVYSVNIDINESSNFADVSTNEDERTGFGDKVVDIGVDLTDGKVEDEMNLCDKDDRIPVDAVINEIAKSPKVADISSIGAAKIGSDVKMYDVDGEIPKTDEKVLDRENVCGDGEIPVDSVNENSDIMHVLIKGDERLDDRMVNDDVNAILSWKEEKENGNENDGNQVNLDSQHEQSLEASVICDNKQGDNKENFDSQHEQHNDKDVLSKQSPNTPGETDGEQKEEQEHSEEGEDENSEEEDDGAEDKEFFVGDFVWGKIKSHPWWPGQIYDPSDASQFAGKYRRRDRYLVAYFGDGTFAWCYPSQLKPFRENFERMSKQSNSKSFLNAVEEVLDEIGRRVESELTCFCISEEIQSQTKRQVAINAGIKAGVLVPDGGLGDLSIAAYDPVRFINHLKDIAQVISVHSNLELTVVTRQLLAFYRSKGYGKLPTYYQHEGISDPEHVKEQLLSNAIDSDEQSVDPDGKSFFPSPNEGVMNKRNASRKRPYILEDKMYQGKKERSMSELMTKNVDAGLEEDNEDEEKEEPTPDNLTLGSKRQRKSGHAAAGKDDENEMFEASTPSSETNSSTRKRKMSNILERVQVSGTRSSSSRKRKNSSHMKSEENDEDVKTGKGRGRKKKKSNQLSSPMEKEEMAFDVEEGDDEVDGSEEEEALGRSEVKCFKSLNPSAGQKGLVSVKDNKSKSLESPKDFRVGASISRIASKLTSSIIRCSNNGSEKKSTGETGLNKNISSKEDQADEAMDGDFGITDNIPSESPSKDKSGKKSRRKGRGDFQTPKNRPVFSTVAMPPTAEHKEICADGSAALILTFSPVHALPSKEDLITAFGKFGELKEQDTELLMNCARIVFTKGSDAEQVFNGLDKIGPLSSSILSSRLRYLPVVRRYSEPLVENGPVNNQANLFPKEDIAIQGTSSKQDENQNTVSEKEEGIVHDEPSLEENKEEGSACDQGSLQEKREETTTCDEPSVQENKVEDAAYDDEPSTQENREEGTAYDDEPSLQEKKEEGSASDEPSLQEGVFQSPLGFMQKNLEAMMSMLTKSQEKPGSGSSGQMSPEVRANLAEEVKRLLEKVATVKSSYDLA